MMYIEVTPAIMVDIMDARHENYYTWEGCESLIEFYDETGCHEEFDFIGITCEWTEYGDADEGCSGVMDFDDLITDYGYLYPVEEFREDEGIEGDEDIDRDEYIAKLVDAIEKRTIVLRVSNGNVIISEF